jgi:hypothetical protein
MKIISHFLILTILSFGKIGYWENNKKILQENNFTNEIVIRADIKPKSKHDILLKENYFSQPKNRKFKKIIFSAEYIIAVAIILLISIYLILIKRRKTIIVKKFPLNIRLGGIVDISAIEQRLEKSKHLFAMKIPKELKGYITAIGVIKLDDDIDIYNLYVSENLDSKEHIFILRMEFMNGNISFVKMLTKYEKIEPTASEWELWLDGDENNYPKLGGLTFVLEPNILYKRIWNKGVNEVVRTKYIEKIMTDDNELDTLNIISLYGRALDENEIEYLFISNIEDAELNNFIRIDIGIGIKNGELSIL